jgi:hypothetical protein
MTHISAQHEGLCLREWRRGFQGKDILVIAWTPDWSVSQLCGKLQNEHGEVMVHDNR